MSISERPPNSLWPFWPFPWGNGSTVNLPSGDVSQMLRIASPTIEVNGRGDPELEGRIVRDVATYGAQIGQLSEIVLALADGKDAPAEPLAKLRAIAEEVAKLKAQQQENALARAREAMDVLREHDPGGYKLLLASLKARGE